MTFTIINTLDLSRAPEATATLEKVGNLISLPPSRGLVLSRIGEADAYLCNASVRIDEEFLDRACRLKVIGSPSTGNDHIDTEAVRRRGITLFDIARERALIGSFSATSELAFGLLLALVRHLPPALEATNHGVWARERFTGFQLLGKTLGIVGLGRLGSISARIGLGFGMRIIAHDVRPVSLAGVQMVDFKTVLQESDVILLHLHLTPETEGLIDEKAFSIMKPNAILINTSRGRIVDERALLRALESRRIAGAGLDVVDGEWLTQEELRAHPLVTYARANNNLLITPHIGGSTVESIYGARIFIADKIARFLSDFATGVAAAR